MKEIKEIRACGEWVVLEAREVEAEEKKTKSGIIIPGQAAEGQTVNSSGGKKTVDLLVYDIGPDARDKVSYKKDDMVIVDNYDMQAIGTEQKTYVLCHYTKVKAIIS